MKQTAQARYMSLDIPMARCYCPGGPGPKFSGRYWFRLNQRNPAHMPGSSLAGLPNEETTGNGNTIPDMAPSIAEADAILAATGYEELAAA